MRLSQTEEKLPLLCIGPRVGLKSSPKLDSLWTYITQRNFKRGIQSITLHRIFREGFV